MCCPLNTMSKLKRSILATLILPISASLCTAQQLVETEFLPPVIPGASHGIADLGHCVLFDGDSLWVSSPSTTLTPSTNRDGVLVRYARSGSGWTFAEALTRPGGPQGDAEEFGHAIARTGDVLVVTAPEAPHVGSLLQTPGIVQVFRGGPGNWVADPGQLISPTPSSSDLFGRSVAASGDWIAVGAARDDGATTAAGAVILYEKTGAGYQFRTKLLAPTSVSLGLFGTSLVMVGDRMIVGEPGHGDGRVHVYERSGGSWLLQQTIQPLGPSGSHEQFGSSVAFELESPGAGTLAVGALAAPPGLRGAIEVHDLFAGVFVFAARFDGSIVPGPIDRLGNAIAIDDGMIVAGAHTNSPIGASGGAAFTFSRGVGGSWFLVDQLLPAEARGGSRVGWAVDVQGDEVAVTGIMHDQGIAGSRGGCWTYGSIPDGASLFGFGDGAAAPCPCGFESTPGRAQGCVNLSGLGGQLIPNGSASLASDALEIDVRNLNGTNITILFEGSGPLSPAAPIGNGLLFMAPGFRRRGVVASNSLGTGTWGAGLLSSSGWSVGQTVMLQAWYRDPNPACVFAYNLTNGVQVTVQP